MDSEESLPDAVDESEMDISVLDEQSDLNTELPSAVIEDSDSDLMAENAFLPDDVRSQWSKLSTAVGSFWVPAITTFSMCPHQLRLHLGFSNHTMITYYAWNGTAHPGCLCTNQ